MGRKGGPDGEYWGSKWGNGLQRSGRRAWGVERILGVRKGGPGGRGGSKERLGTLRVKLRGLWDGRRLCGSEWGNWSGVLGEMGNAGCQRGVGGMNLGDKMGRLVGGGQERGHEKPEWQTEEHWEGFGQGTFGVRTRNGGRH